MNIKHEALKNELAAGGYRQIGTSIINPTEIRVIFEGWEEVVAVHFTFICKWATTFGYIRQAWSNPVVAEIDDLGNLILSGPDARITIDARDLQTRYISTIGFHI